MDLHSEQEFRGTNAGKCMETAGSSSAGSLVKTWSCDNPAKHWQQWVIDGSRIRYKDDTDKCLEIRDGIALLGTELTIDTCDDSPEQQWAVEPLSVMPLPTAGLRLRNVAGDNCADPDVNDSTSGVDAAMSVQGFPCLGPDRENQTWTFTATGRLINGRNPDLCLDGRSGSTGDYVTVDDCHQGSNQQWSYEGGLLRNLNEGRCLRAGVDGGDMQWYGLAVCDASASTQQWVIEPNTNPTTAEVVHLRNAAFGDCAEPRPDAGSNDNKIWTLPCDSTRELQSFVWLSSGELRPATRINMCIDGNLSTGASLRVWTCDRMPSSNVPTNQHQQFLSLSDGRIQNVKNTGSCLQGHGNALEVEFQSCTAGLLAQQWNVEPPGSGASTLRQLRNVGTGSCIEQPGSRTILWPCSGGARSGQGVFVLSNDEIRRADDLNQCLVIHDGSNSSGARLRWYQCSTSNFGNQRWHQDPVDGQPGQVRLRSYQSGGSSSSGGKCIEGFLDTAELEMRDCNSGNSNQRWTFEAPTDQRVVRQIRNEFAGACLDLPNDASNGAQLMLFPCLGSDRPMQAFLQLNNGQFRPMSNLDKCLNVNGGGPLGNPLIIWTCEGGTSEPLPDSSVVAPGYQLKVKGSSPARCEYFDVGANQPKVGNCTSTPSDALDRQTWFLEPVGTSSDSGPLQYRSGPASTAWCLDAVGPTSSSFGDGTQLQSFPCLGSSRPNQSFVAMTNGMIRSLTTPGLCLDSGEHNNGGLALRGCNTGAWNQRWVPTADGQLRNLYGTELRRCMQGGLDGDVVQMVTCTANGGQVLTGEAVGATVRPDVEGRLRSQPSDSCLEPDAVAGGGNTPAVWTQPCVGPSRVQQYFLRLNNGQLRAQSNTTRCLDAYDGRSGQGVRVGPCNAPASANPQQTWDVDASGLRSRAVDTDGQRRCVQLVGDAAYVTQQPCSATVDAQRWTFEASP